MKKVTVLLIVLVLVLVLSSSAFATTQVYVPNEADNGFYRAAEITDVFERSSGGLFYDHNYADLRINVSLK